MRVLLILVVVNLVLAGINLGLYIFQGKWWNLFSILISLFAAVYVGIIYIKLRR